jgi:sodium/bile acid cotransporter 7
MRRITLLLVLGLTAISVAVFLWLRPPASDEARRERITRLYKEYRKSFPEVAGVSPAGLRLLRERVNVVLVDVRSAEERAISVIPGAVAVEDFEADLDRYRDAAVVTYCTIGLRSGLYAQRLLRDGTRAFNLEGSILAWVHEGGTLQGPEGTTRRVHVYGRRWNLVPDGYEAVW